MALVPYGTTRKFSWREEVQILQSNFIENCRILGSHSGGFEGFCLLGYNAVYSVESQSMFRRNISPPSSGSKSKAIKKPA
jgi:hypothetical protein